MHIIPIKVRFAQVYYTSAAQPQRSCLNRHSKNNSLTIPAYYLLLNCFSMKAAIIMSDKKRHLARNNEK